jgi:hypothetical protein
MLLLVVLSAPTWITATFVVASLVVLVLILAAYIYFAKSDPAALRSERYALIKDALNRDLQGDSLSKLANIIDVGASKELGGSSDSKQLGPGHE